MNSPPLIECRNIIFERDDIPLFSGINFQVFPSRALRVTGANGAGKTTLLRILAGSLVATDGEILWRGKSLYSCMAQYRANMLYLGHNSGVKSSLTPRENLQWYCRLFPQLSGDIDGALGQVNLDGYEDVACQSLSAGQQRRVALAKLYLSNAPVWILDEPFTSIDAHGVASLESLMEGHLAAGGCLILTSHQYVDLKQVESLDLENFAFVD